MKSGGSYLEVEVLEITESQFLLILHWRITLASLTAEY